MIAGRGGPVPCCAVHGVFVLLQSYAYLPWSIFLLLLRPLLLLLLLHLRVHI